MDGTRFRFEDLVLDVARRELTRAGQPVALEPQVFDLLVYVIENRDRVVSKDDLVEAVWGGRAISDSTLTTRINAMRKALGDSGEEQRLIRTVARKGIRFVGAVTEEALLAASLEKSAECPPLALPDQPSIAVLPFQNMSGDPEQDYFADGLTEDIIIALSKWRWFFVIAHSSSFVYKGRAINMKQIGRELGVRYVLEGSVRKAGTNARITAQLIETATATNVWSQRYDRNVSDVLDVQDEITGQIARALDIELTEAESSRRARERPSHPEAQDLVLKARALLNQRVMATRFDENDRSYISGARQLLLKAAELDTSVPGLYSALARTHLNDIGYGWSTDTKRSIADAMDATQRALQFDARDASARISKGIIHRWKGEADESLAELTHAYELNPSNPLAYSHLAATLTQLGRPDEACDAARRALRLNPHQATGFIYLGQAYFHSGRYTEAIDSLRRAVRIAPSQVQYRAYLAAAFALNGQEAEAQAALEEMRGACGAVSIEVLRSFEHAGHPRWHAERQRMYSALRAAGVPE